MNNTGVSRREYLAGLKKRKRAVLTVQAAVFLGVVAFWELAGRCGLADSFIISGPVRMWKTFWDMSSAGLWRHVAYTVGETVSGFLIGGAIGFVLRVGLWYSPFASRVFAPFLVVLNSLPKVALGPVIIVWAGAGAQAIITMAVAISLIVTVMELSRGFESTSQSLLITVKSLGADRWTAFKKIVLPSNIPTLFQSLKVNIGLSLVGVIAGEFLVSKAGLGYLIVYAGQVFKMDLVMMSVVLLGIIAFGMYSAVSRLEKLAEKLINH